MLAAQSARVPPANAGWRAAGARGRKITMPRPRPTSAFARLELRVLIGAIVGLGYTLLDSYLDRTLGAQLSAPVRPVEILHTVIDFVLPTVTGALFGVAVHYMRMRQKLVELERQRANNLNDDLHKIERDQAVWVISASLLHELKNPLHALGLLVDEAVEANEGEPQQRHQLLLRARAQVERMTRELATLRALPSSARPDLPDVDVEPIVERAVAAIVQRTPSIVVDWRPGDEPGVWAKASPAYVRIILENLLENAVDALTVDAARGEPRIVIVVRQMQGQCAIEVSDNGPGMDPEARLHLFEPLRTTKQAGMGLGLAIAHALARAIGGDLQLIEQARGVGFRLLLESGGVPA